MNDLQTASIPERSTVNLIPGSIVFLRRGADAFKFMQGRPLLVLKVQNFEAPNNVIVVMIGSSGHLPGIVVHLPSPVHDDWIGGKDTSYIYPWSVMSVSEGALSTPCGFLNPQILKTVRQCVAYHMGFTKNRPPYLEGEEKPIEWHLPNQSELIKDEPINNPPTEETIKERKKITPKFVRTDIPYLSSYTKTFQGGETVYNYYNRFTNESEIAEILMQRSPDSEACKDYGISLLVYKNLRNYLRRKYITKERATALKRIIEQEEVQLSKLSALDLILIALYSNSRFFAIPTSHYNWLVEFAREALNLPDTTMNHFGGAYRVKIINSIKP